MASALTILCLAGAVKTQAGEHAPGRSPLDLRSTFSHGYGLGVYDGNLVWDAGTQYISERSIHLDVQFRDRTGIGGERKGDGGRLDARSSGGIREFGMEEPGCAIDGRRFRRTRDRPHKLEEPMVGCCGESLADAWQDDCDTSLATPLVTATNSAGRDGRRARRKGAIQLPILPPRAARGDLALQTTGESLAPGDEVDGFHLGGTRAAGETTPQPRRTGSSSASGRTAPPVVICAAGTRPPNGALLVPAEFADLDAHLMLRSVNAARTGSGHPRIGPVQVSRDVQLDASPWIAILRGPFEPFANLAARSPSQGPIVY